MQRLGVGACLAPAWRGGQVRGLIDSGSQELFQRLGPGPFRLWPGFGILFCVRREAPEKH